MSVKAIVCVSVLSVCGNVLAQDGADAPSVESESSFADRVSFSASIDFTNQYFFRGIIQESGGFIVQPAFELGFDLYEGEDVSLGMYTGVWNSFHDRRTGSGDPDEFVASWYEFDFYGGLSLTTGRLTTDVVYTNYASPNDAFGHIEEISLNFGWDDSGWIDGVTLSPYVTVAFEIGSNQADGGSDLGTFLAIGMEPSHTYEGTGIGDVTVSLPIEAGFSLGDYYEGPGGDESFGYFTVGLAASVPLPMPESYGAWSWSVGVDYLLLGDSNEIANRLSEDEWLVHTGLSFEF